MSGCRSMAPLVAAAVARVPSAAWSKRLTAHNDTHPNLSLAGTAVRGSGEAVDGEWQGLSSDSQACRCSCRFPVVVDGA